MSKPSDIVIGAFIGDALALGPHWIYDPAEIKKHFGRVNDYRPPMATYHLGKRAGDFTHYGDQTLVLLRSICETANFNLARFANEWRNFWESPETLAYRDSATKTTLAHLQSETNSPSLSSDLAGVGRIAPLFLSKWTSDDELVLAARVQTAFTHGDLAVIEAAAYFAQVVLAVKSGTPIDAALKNTLTEGTWHHLPSTWLDEACRSSSSDDLDEAAMHQIGLSCHISDAFPSVCHLLLRYPESPAQALIENVNAGGDSAARGMILGMVYGAAFPVSDWPAQWLSKMNALHEIETLIETLN